MLRDTDTDTVWLMTMPAAAPPAVELADEFRKVAGISDITDAANIVFDRLQADGRLDLLRPLVAHALYSFRRAGVRALEHAVSEEANDTGTVDEADEAAPTGGTRKRRKAHGSSGRLPSLADLLDEEFYTGKKWVRYVTASPDDFTASMTYLQTQIDGIGRTIAFRERCRAAILAHPGATCLRDVPHDVVADVMRGA